MDDTQVWETMTDEEKLAHHCTELARYLNEVPQLVKHGHAINFAFIRRTLRDMSTLQSKVYRGTFTAQGDNTLLP